MTARLSRRSLGIAIPILVLVAGGVALTVPVLSAVYFPGSPYAESALSWSHPDPRTGKNPSLGELQWTADELNRVHQGHEWGPIIFVPADVPSTRPTMVSVNPIDQYTWGAAAYSIRTNRCYLILTAQDPSNPHYGGTFYGRLAQGSSCVGLAATRQTVTSPTQLPEA
jgi:hypothetical protein